MIAEKLTEFGMEAFSFNTDEYDSIGLTSEKDIGGVVDVDHDTQSIPSIHQT